jgi:hypothetical protein
MSTTDNSPFGRAVTNRSLRIVRNELEFLVESGVITPGQYHTIITNIPTPNGTSAHPANNVAVAVVPDTPPTYPMQNLNLNGQQKQDEKTGAGYYAETPNTNQGPPAYPVAPAVPAGPPALSYAMSLYQYNAQDAGDLAMMPNDRIAVTEYMNAEWWRGKNERTGQEGIFPRSYVKPEENKAFAPSPSPAPQPHPYGDNMELQVANSGGNKVPGKGEEMGKKFGKKLGNAAIFGAGTTIGGKIVNGIF